MITLKNDSLSFSFPEIDEVLRQLVEQHINATLPAILAADRANAVQALQSFWGFREASPEQRRKAESQVIDARTKEIEAALRRACMSVLGNGVWWPFAEPTEQTSITALHIEFQRSVAHAFDLLHVVSNLFKHAANLTISAFDP